MTRQRWGGRGDSGKFQAGGGRWAGPDCVGLVGVSGFGSGSRQDELRRAGTVSVSFTREYPALSILPGT